MMPLSDHCPLPTRHTDKPLDHHTGATLMLLDQRQQSQKEVK